MPDFDVYFGDDEGIDAESRAFDSWNRIKRDPTIIDIIRNTTTLAAQTVRVEFSGTGEEGANAAGRSGRQRVVVFGVVDHPTITDTNIQARDRFALNKVQYEVITVVFNPGDIQAYCEAIR